ncbi:MAG: VOC family protein [Actinomycetota bacterium]|nr:VOC family protein [Actinomycetota bacterium]
MSATAASLPPFHLAVPVSDIGTARTFYGEILGLDCGRSAERWIDWNLGGHQLVTHQVDGYKSTVAGRNPVDGHDVPVPHFGLVLTVEQFHALARRLTDAGVDFVIAPHVRFPSEPGEQWTMFFLDPSGNALEFKAFADPSHLFAG